ncbi:unnamed protein product [Penicillium bialowiezense]
MEPDIIPLKQALAAAGVRMHEPPAKSADCVPPAKSAMKQTVPPVSRKSKRHSYPRPGSQGFGYRPTTTGDRVHKVVLQVKGKSRNALAAIRRWPSHVKKFVKLPRALKKKLAKANRPVAAADHEAANEEFVEDLASDELAYDEFADHEVAIN